MIDAEFFILIFALVLAVVRGLPGKRAAPAALASRSATSDFFRGIPPSSSRS